MLITLANTNEAAPLGDLGNLPQIVLGVYLCMLLLLGYIGYRKSRTSEEDYYLAGRSQGWVVSSLTIMATFFSSWALLGAPGAVYKDGVAFILFALNVPLSGACVYIFGKRIARAGRKMGYVTPGDMIADYYGSRFSLRVLAALVGFLYAVPYIVMQIKSGGVLARTMFPGEHAFEIGAIILSCITMIYIMVGGMRSVAWTDVIQGALLMTGMIVAGLATVMSFKGGVSGFFAEVSKELPAEAQRVPGPSETWTMGKLFTLCLFGSIASLIQPAQWMRYYAAKSVATLRRSAIIFSVVLTACFLFGVMLVGLGGRVLYPPTVTYEVTTPAPFIDTEEPGEPVTQVYESKPTDLPADATLVTKIEPHPRLAEMGGDSNDILVLVLRDKGTVLLGALGGLIVSIIFVAIMAAAMSTADSNLHALSGVMTRDIFDRFIAPEASDRVRTWFGRGVIFVATGLALWLVIQGENDDSFEPVRMIAKMGVLAVAFSAQLIPVTVDMLFLRKGSKHGAVFGIIVGLVIVFCFTPFFSILLGQSEPGEKVLSIVGDMRKLIDIGAWGLCGNVAVFVIISLITPKPDPARVKRLADIMDGVEPKQYK